MIEIIPCKDRLDELVQFVAVLNSDSSHHIGFFGEGEADVRSSLAECLIPPSEGFTMAYDGEQLVGIFGVDADPEINRAWLFGPLVEHVEWHEVADKLYAKVLPRIPVSIRDYELFCDIQNTRMEAFAVRHGYPMHSENAVLTLARENYNSSAEGKTPVTPYHEEFFEPFEQLHKALFPKGYFTARQMVEKIDENHRLFLAVEKGQLLGYHFCKIEPASGSGYVEFIGTDLSGRGRGVGPNLLAPGVDWMLFPPTTEKINLTGNPDKVPARHLYQKFGFCPQTAHGPVI